MPEIVVVGGSVAGLTTALALARGGQSVTVLERGTEPLARDADEAFAQTRRGVPQRHHSHGLLARLREVLAAGAPDVLARLVGAGANEIPFCDHLPPGIADRTPRPGDDRLVAIACRRTTLEWVLRQVVEEEDRVTLMTGCAAVGLVTDDGPDGLRRVTGVARRGADDGAMPALAADLVVDASGRWSQLGRWLADAGADPPASETSDCGLLYTSRFYRLHPGAEAPVDGPIGGDLRYCKYGVFVGDDRTVSVTFAIPPDDRALRRLLEPAAFDAAARALVATRPWVMPEVAAPISGVSVMARLTNTRRRMVDDGAPVALGVLAVGDAAVHTNPLYGRGCALAAVQAFALAELVTGHGDDLGGLARAWDGFLDAEIGPWFDNAVYQDRQNHAVLRAGRAEEPLPADAPLLQMAELMEHGVFPAARTDPEVHRAFLRVFNLLELPGALLGDHDIVRRVLDAWSRRAERPPPDPLGPPRHELLQILAEA